LIGFTVEEIDQKIGEMEQLNDEIKSKTVTRGRSLEEALNAAQRFWDIYNDLTNNFNEIQDCINSQDSPQVSTKCYYYCTALCRLPMVYFSEP